MRDSCLGIILLLERPLEGLNLIFSTSWLKAKATSSVTGLFLLKYNVVLLGVAVEGFHNTIPCLIFQRREYLFLEKVIKEGLRADFHIFTSRPSISHHIFAVGVCTTILEGKIFSARISLALERSIRGGLLQIVHIIHPYPYSFSFVL